MCNVCEQKGNTAEAMLRPFLKEGVEIEHDQIRTIHGKWEHIKLTYEGKSIVVTADGDAGGYFHFKGDE